VVDGDTLFFDTLLASQISVFRSKREWRKYYRLIWNFNKTYPYALVARKLVAKADSTFQANDFRRRQREKYVNAVQDELFDAFEKPMRNMTISQGRLLIKLIDREVGKSSYNIIKDYKSGMAAGFWQGVAKVFGTDLKKNYERLNVTFDLWNGESTVHDRIPAMVDAMKQGGYAYYSDGALVVDVKEDTDTKEVPPCMILKSDGASLYNTTDLATIQMRMEENHPDEIIYLTDKRQELYFTQVFRCARKTGLVKPETKLVHIGFGTVNGKDGKPFKTRDGGVMRLESLITEINDEMYAKITENREMDTAEAAKTAQLVALSAIKYGDLSNQASKDYIFDIDRFTSFEGDTGPYILYTIVRIKSILNKYKESGADIDETAMTTPSGESEKALMLELAKYNASIEAAYDELAPNKICAYIYDIANAFNRFYHETKILTEEDETKKKGYIALLVLTRDILETCIDLLGFAAPERM